MAPSPNISHPKTESATESTPEPSNISSEELTLEKTTQVIIQLFDSVGVIQNIKKTHHKDFAILETRLKTFDKCKKQMKQDIQTLCEAGFYYIGDGENNQVICFCCNQGLKDWEDENEPWTEHAKCSPTCSHVLLKKGKYFVDVACGLTPNQEELYKMIADNKYITIFWERYVVADSILRNLNSPESIIEPIIVPLLSSYNSGLFQSSSKICDSMLCKICYIEEIKIAFFPCGHVFACIQCALAIDQCAVCRYPFKKAVNVNIIADPEQEPNQTLPCSSSKCYDESYHLCKVCGKEKMATVFMPCRHIYACVKCSSEMPKCPVCKDVIFLALPVYL